MKQFLTSLTTAALLLTMLCVPSSASGTTTVAQNGHGDAYDSLKDAIEDTYDTYGGGTVTLTAANYVLTEDLTIPEGIQLTIPTSAAGDDTVNGTNGQGGKEEGTAYATLTVPTGVTLTVNGTLLAAGNQQSTQPASGCRTGNFGKIDLAGDLVVKSGGKLYARGELSGAGKVTAESGSEVYQLFQIQDWRGGTKAVSANNAGVFPFSLYEFTSITEEADYYKGSTLKGQYYIYAGGSGVSGAGTVLGSGGQMSFASNAAATDYVTITHAPSSDTLVTLHGAVETGSISVNMSLYGIPYTVSSAGKVCPFGYNMDVTIASGASLTIADDMKFLPGCDITVEQGGVLTVAEGASAYFYDAGGYSPSYNFKGWDSDEDATLTVNGSMTVNGVLASTDGTMGNLSGVTAMQDANGNAVTVQISEYSNSSGASAVTFYRATLTAAAAN